LNIIHLGNCLHNNPSRSLQYCQVPSVAFLSSSLFMLIDEDKELL
jgi:hypothetical protein